MWGSVNYWLRVYLRGRNGWIGSCLCFILILVLCFDWHFVNLNRVSIHLPIAVLDSASMTHLPTGSIRTILSIDSSNSQSSNGSRSTVFVPPLSTLPDISDFQSNTSVVLVGHPSHPRTILRPWTIQSSKTRSMSIVVIHVLSLLAVVAQWDEAVWWRI